MSNSNTNSNIDPDGFSKNLAEFLLKQQDQEKLDQRHEKLKRILILLAGGASLALALASPKSTRLMSYFQPDKSDWDEWKMFNKRYLQNTIRRLQKQKIIEVEDFGNHQMVKITSKGKTKVLQYSFEALKIDKPPSWDGKWRLIFDHIFDHQKQTRNRLQRILKNSGFYPLQKSVYLHAYPCEAQVEFLRNFLGIGGEVRLVIADKIENDTQFRTYFGV